MEKTIDYSNYNGKMIGNRYIIEKCVGQGGMAVVFAAMDTVMKRRVAVKMLHEQFQSNPNIVRRFIIESQAIARFNHNNIVKIYDVVVDGPQKFIVMEYLEGMTLNKYMSYKKGPIDWRDATIYIAQILRALDHAHQNGVVHRDIKPQNIMLLEGGYVKVMDFGIAKMLDAKDQTLTTNNAIGTVYYMSPEQAQGKSIDNRSDIYSLGCMFYQMVTGEFPFFAKDPIAVALKQINEEPVPPTRLNPSIPSGLEQIILCAMQKNPADRYQSAPQMLRHLHQIEADPTVVFLMKRPSPKTPTSEAAVSRTQSSAEKYHSRPYANQSAPSHDENASVPRAPQQNAPLQTKEQARRQQYIRQAAQQQPVQRAEQASRPVQQSRQPAGQPIRSQNAVSRAPQSERATQARTQNPPRTATQSGASTHRKAAETKKRTNRPRGDKPSYNTISVSTVIFVFVLFLVLAVVSLIVAAALAPKMTTATDFALDIESATNTVVEKVVRWGAIRL